MPGTVKIGFTMGPPSARAAELSRATGVPCQFEVLAYAEVENPQAVERRIHEAMQPARISLDREFFAVRCLDHVADLITSIPDAISVGLGVCAHHPPSGRFHYGSAWEGGGPGKVCFDSRIAAYAESHPLSGDLRADGGIVDPWPWREIADGPVTADGGEAT